MKKIREIKGKLKDKKLLVLGIVSVLLISVVGTYAYYTATASNNNVVSVTAASAGLKLTITKKAGGDTLVPQLTDYLGSALTGTNKSSCIDGNGNTVCQVYEIKIENTGTSTAILTGTIEISGGTYSNLMWEELKDVKTRKDSPKANSSSETSFVSSLSLKKDASETYYVAIWIAETSSSQNTTDSGTFTGTVSFNFGDGTGVTSTFTEDSGTSSGGGSVETATADTTLAKLGISKSDVKTLGTNY